MRQSGDWTVHELLTQEKFRQILTSKIDMLDVNQARQEVAPFVTDQRMLEVWCREFFMAVVERIELQPKQLLQPIAVNKHDIEDRSPWPR